MAFSFIKRNMGNLDRVIRAISGIGMLYFSQNIVSTMGSTLLMVIGVIFVVTAILSYCPLYDIAGLSTHRKVDSEGAA